MFFLVSRIAVLYWIAAFTISDTTYLYINKYTYRSTVVLEFQKAFVQSVKSHLDLNKLNLCTYTYYIVRYETGPCLLSVTFESHVILSHPGF